MKIGKGFIYSLNSLINTSNLSKQFDTPTWKYYFETNGRGMRIILGLVRIFLKYKCF